MKVYITALCCAVAMLSAVGVSQAVVVNNFSFETDADGSALPPTDWTYNGVGGGGIWTGDATEGLNHLNLGDGAAASQTLGEVMTLGTEYQATADAKSGWQGIFSITLYSDDGLGGLADLATTVFDTTGLGNSTAYAPISVVYTTIAGDVGNSLGIRLESASGWSDFDNVTVEVIPEPATLGFVGLTTVGALFIRRRLMM